MMKKLIYILTSLVLISCVGTAGIDEQDGRNPLSETVLQSSAEAGGEAVIQWNGFTEDVSVSLVNADGESYEMKVDVVTASGLVFFIPADLPAGVYKVVILIAGKTSELGEMEVTASEDAPGTEPDPEPTPEPELPVAAKTLVRIEYYSPYSGSSQLLRAWDITRTPVPTLRVSEYIVDGLEQTLAGYDEYVTTADKTFRLKTDGLEMSNHVEMSYVVEENGRVAAAEVLYYGKKSTTRHTWEYDAQQRLAEISYMHADKGEIQLAGLSYEASCLIGFDGIVYEYDDPYLVNAACAADVVWGYRAVCKGHTDPALFVPYLMGWYDVKSALLPTGMKLPDSSGTGTVSCSFSYEFDDDGYAVSMSWKEGNSNLRVVYVYE